MLCKGTMYNREAWMYKDLLCSVNLCDGYGTKDRLAGAAGDVIKRELTLKERKKERTTPLGVS